MTVAATLSRFRLLQLRRLWRHRLRTLLSVLGVATGVALVVAVATVHASVSTTAESVASLSEGGAFEIVRPGGFDDRALADISSVAGVHDTSTAVHVPALLDGEAGWLIGIEPSPALGGLGAMVAAVTEPTGGVALEANAGVKVTGIDGRTTDLAVDAAATPELRDAFGGRFVAAPVEQATELAGTGRPTSVIVFGTPDRDDLRSAAGPGASIQTAEDKIAFAQGALAPILSSLLLIALMGLVVGAALVYNTVNTNASENINETAALRALGSDRRAARLGAILEGLLIGLVGSIAGLGLGVLMGAGAVETVPDAFSNLVGSPIQPFVPWWLPVLSLAAGVGISLISIVGPVRAAGRVEPIQGIRQTDTLGTEPSATSPVQITLGLVLIAVSALLSGGLGIVAAAIGAILTLRGALPWLARSIGGVAARFGPTGRLAALAVARSPRRAWSTALVVVLTSGISIMAIGALNDFTRTSEADLSTAGAPTFWVSTVSGDEVPVVGLPVEWRRAIAEIDGVTAVASTRLVATGFEGKQVGVLGVDGESAYSFYALAPASARAAVQDGSGIVVNRQFADTFELEVGDTITMPGSSDETTVVAITEGVAVAEGGLAVVSADTLQRVFGMDIPASFEVTTDPQRAGDVRRSLEALTTSTEFPVRVIPSDEFLDDALTSVDQIRSLMVVILAVIAICAGIAVFNTFAATVLARRREFAVLRAIGTSRRRIRRSVVAEALATALVAGVLGVLLGSYLHFLASGALSSFFHIDYQFSPGIVVLSLATSVLIVLAGSFGPVRRGTSGSILDSLASE